MCVCIRLTDLVVKSPWEVCHKIMVGKFLTSFRGFGCGYFLEMGKTMAIKLYLASLLALPASFTLCFCLDSCLDGRRGSRLFAND